MTAQLIDISGSRNFDCIVAEIFSGQQHRPSANPSPHGQQIKGPKEKPRRSRASRERRPPRYCARGAVCPVVSCGAGAGTPAAGAGAATTAGEFAAVGGVRWLMPQKPKPSTTAMTAAPSQGV